MSRGPDAATQLARGLEEAGPGIVVAQCRSTPWASATFAGARHRLTLEARATPDFDRWLDALPDAELALRGHLVADLTLASVDRCGDRATAVIEALTVED